jgi:phenylacetate-CoA ligase
LAGSLSITPEAIFCISEVLTKDPGIMMEEAWGVQPFNIYAATETAGIASECSRHEGLNMSEDPIVAEAVDEDYRPVGPGGYSARLLVTVLFPVTSPSSDTRLAIASSFPTAAAHAAALTL